MICARGPVRVCIAAEHASATMGGEAMLPLHIFRALRRMDIDAWLVVHDRNRVELLAELGEQGSRVRFVSDSRLQRMICRAGAGFPEGLRYFTTGFIVRLSTQWRARREVKRLVAEAGVNVVHEPTPVSPRNPSLMVGLGAPLVVGPLNGNMSWPPVFQRMGSRLGRCARAVGTVVSTTLLSRVMSGRRRAALVLVANERTRRALPAHQRSAAILLPENGVWPELWPAMASRPHRDDIQFVFVGRLVPLKGVDHLIHAFAGLGDRESHRLVVVGDGPDRDRLQGMAQRLGVADRVDFRGFVSHREIPRVLATCDVFVFPSLHDCGGAAVLEAMAAGLPVIATNWGGPADYVKEGVGVLVSPDHPKGFAQGLQIAMQQLASDAEMRARMGSAGRELALCEFSWTRKAELFVRLYEQVLAARGIGDPSVTSCAH